MTAEEIIAEVRSIAAAMAIRGVHPGEVSGSVRYRVIQLLRQCPFAPWFSRGRRYLTQHGTATVNGQPAAIQVVKSIKMVKVIDDAPTVTDEVPAVIDDSAVEICKAIIDHLNVANWKQMVDNELTPHYRDWTPDVAEAAIRNAAQELPTLCDRLEHGNVAEWSDYRTPTEWRKAWQCSESTWREHRDALTPDLHPVSKQRRVRFRRADLQRLGLAEPRAQV
jgi:hypothetical protein